MKPEDDQEQVQCAINNKSITKAVDEIQLILEYISINGIEVDKDVLKILINARTELKKDKFSSDKEVEFWQAYTKISKAIFPVTLESIKSTKNEFGKKGIFGRLMKGGKVSDARRSLMGYRLIAIFVLISVLVIQIVWLIGNTLVIDATKQMHLLENQLNDDKELELDSYFAKLSNDSTAILKYKTDVQILHSQINSTVKNIIVNQDLISTWSKTAKYLIPPISVISMEGKGRQNYEEIRQKFNQGLLSHDQIKLFMLSEAKITHALVVPLKMILLYVLPLLYGLLGACAFVLRVLGKNIREYTYIKGHNINLSLRLQLGALAGLIIGWFVSPASNGDVNDISVTNLSPLALSFLAGYSIELLFTAMDKYVFVYSKKSDKKTGAID